MTLVSLFLICYVFPDAAGNSVAAIDGPISAPVNLILPIEARVSGSTEVASGDDSDDNLRLRPVRGAGVHLSPIVRRPTADLQSDAAIARARSSSTSSTVTGGGSFRSRFAGVVDGSVSPSIGSSPLARARSGSGFGRPSSLTRCASGISIGLSESPVGHAEIIDHPNTIVGDSVTGIVRNPFSDLARKNSVVSIKDAERLRSGSTGDPAALTPTTITQRQRLLSNPRILREQVVSRSPSARMRSDSGSSMNVGEGTLSTGSPVASASRPKRDVSTKRRY